MKAKISKYKLRKSSIIIDNENLKYSEEAMKRTWSEFGDALAHNHFEYTDTDKALTIT